MAALAAQPLSHDLIIHPRGHPISVAYTCPGCGMLHMARRIDRRNGINTCHNCKTSVLFGICVFLLPHDPQGAHSLAPDSSLPPKERTMRGLRTRSRKARMAYLASLGLGDPMPQIAPQPYIPGNPINRVVLVPAPQPEAVSVDQVESSNPTNPVAE